MLADAIQMALNPNVATVDSDNDSASAIVLLEAACPNLPPGGRVPEFISVQTACTGIRVRHSRATRRRHAAFTVHVRRTILGSTGRL